MAKVTVGLPQGTRDFGPDVVRKRNYILSTIRNVFELYGFQPLETPAMENLDTLMGKYGEEGDKLIFKILNNGDLIKGIDKKDLFQASIDSFTEYVHGDYEFMKDLKLLPASLSQSDRKEFGVRILKEFDKYLKDTYLTKRALKYDLTIPFARYVAMNHGQLLLPFKRYQIQPVWRADRPQKGRYREFYQCDADVVGSVDLITELELLAIYDDVFNRLKIPGIEVNINSRAILRGLAICLDLEEKLTEITTEIDKLDKVGLSKVLEALTNKGVNDWQIKFIEKYLTITGDTDIDRINNMYDLFKSTGRFEYNSAYADLFGRVRSILEYSKFKFAKLKIDFTLARGLSYYTGLIVEVKCKKVEMGSIGGGGTYHNLTALFGVDNLPGVGISFGVDRIYDVLEELKLFPDDLKKTTTVLFFNLGTDSETKDQVGFNEIIASLSLAKRLRENGVSCEIYPKSGIKFDKQFKYAEKKNIPYIVIIGSDELRSNTCKVKNIQTGQQQTIPQDQLTQFPFI